MDSIDVFPFVIKDVIALAIAVNNNQIEYITTQSGRQIEVCRYCEKVYNDCVPHKLGCAVLVAQDVLTRLQQGA